MLKTLVLRKKWAARLLLRRIREFLAKKAEHRRQMEEASRKIKEAAAKAEAERK